MKVRATRGVCIGPGRHLAAGDTEDLDAATVAFLVSINAVEVVVESPPALELTADGEISESETETKSTKQRKEK